jgi:hypothetical protein
MKKILILIVCILVLSLTACGFNKHVAETPTTTAPTEPPLGEFIDDDTVNLYDENNQHYTAENLPDNYVKKDFDGDGLNNKDEIANGTDMYKVDTDGDGIGYHDEIYKTKTDPLKWSSRDDGVSDLEYSIVNQGEFKEGYTNTDANGFKMYLAKPEDRLYIISKVSTNTFDELETISESFQIKSFNGKMALNCNKYMDDVANSIAIYKDVNGVATKIETVVDENRLVTFNVNSNDIIVVVYEVNN